MRGPVLNVIYRVRLVLARAAISALLVHLIGGWLQASVGLSALRIFFRGKTAVGGATITVKTAMEQALSAARRVRSTFL